MFCHKCGAKNDESSKYCIKCGQSLQHEKNIQFKPVSDHEQKWWMRLAKVVYVILYLPLLLILLLVWEDNKPYYSVYSDKYIGDYGDVIWYGFLSLLIYVVILRFIKITFLYIAFAQKPQWDKEIKRLY